ncbi:MAG: hypothetical protein ACOH1I_00020 [Gallionellaceae bacterium]|jgi:hypothetical protein
MDEKILKLLNNKEEYYPTQLTEKYPHILDKIMMMWDSPEFDSYLNKFMLDKREHPRHGFPPEVASELLRLSMLHSSIFGMHSSKLWIEPSNIRID